MSQKAEISSESENPKRRLSISSLRTAFKIFAFLRPYRSMFIAGMTFLLVSSFTTMTFPYLMGKLIDTASIKDATSIFADTNKMALLLLGLLILQAIISFFRVYLFATVTEKAMADVRQVLYDKLVTLSIPFFEERRVGELTSRSTNDVDQLQDMLSMTLPEFIRQIVTIFFGVGFIFFISAKLTLLMISTFPVLIILALVYGKFIRKLSKQRQDALAESNIVVEETMQNIATVKAYANERYESVRYSGFMKRVVDAGIKGAVNRGAFTTFLIFGLFGGFVLVLWYGAVLMKEGEVTAGTLTAFMLYTGFIGGAVGGIGDLYGRLQKTVGASERVFDILETPGEVDMEPAPEHEPRLSGAITFNHVVFSYPTRKDIQVLKDVSLQIHSGQKIALAGSSGAGKSTIAQLVLGFYQPEMGTISIDGKNFHDYSLKYLRRNMAVVPQEVILFGGSIRENIAYGKPGASEEEIMAAAKKAHAWEFITGFPEKMDTIVGERGVKLSGGQRQRIAIARAILKDPSILILDEATSSLDAESERLVQEALEVLMEGRTTIIIAHRLSTIRNADHIFVLDAGQIAEQGSFDELALIPQGIFANLLKLQFLDKDNN
jgi:ATP-binding cassette subfamily B protein